MTSLANLAHLPPTTYLSSRSFCHKKKLHDRPNWVLTRVISRTAPSNSPTICCCKLLGRVLGYKWEREHKFYPNGTNPGWSLMSCHCLWVVNISAHKIRTHYCYSKLYSISVRVSYMLYLCYFDFYLPARLFLKLFLGIYFSFTKLGLNCIYI